MYIVKTGNTGDTVKKFVIKYDAVEYFKSRLEETIKRSPYLTGLEKMSILAAIDGFMYRFRGGLDTEVKAFGIELKSE